MVAQTRSQTKYLDNKTSTGSDRGSYGPESVDQADNWSIEVQAPAHPPEGGIGLPLEEKLPGRWLHEEPSMPPYLYNPGMQTLREQVVFVVEDFINGLPPLEYIQANVALALSSICGNSDPDTGKLNHFMFWLPVKTWRTGFVEDTDIILNLEQEPMPKSRWCLKPEEQRKQMPFLCAWSEERIAVVERKWPHRIPKGNEEDREARWAAACTRTVDKAGNVKINPPPTWITDTTEYTSTLPITELKLAERTVRPDLGLEFQCGADPKRGKAQYAWVSVIVSRPFKLQLQPPRRAKRLVTKWRALMEERDRLKQQRYVIEQTIAQCIVNREGGGPGLGLAIAGDSFTRILALTDKRILVEIAPVPSPSTEHEVETHGNLPCPVKMRRIMAHAFLKEKVWDPKRAPKTGAIDDAAVRKYRDYFAESAKLALALTGCDGPRASPKSGPWSNVQPTACSDKGNTDSLHLLLYGQLPGGCDNEIADPQQQNCDVDADEAELEDGVDPSDSVSNQGDNPANSESTILGVMSRLGIACEPAFSQEMDEVIALMAQTDP